MKYGIIIVVAVLILMSYLLSNKNIVKNDMKNVDLYLDVRTIDEWNAGHNAKAKNIPLDQLEARLKEISEYKDKNIVVVCRSGNRAETAKAILQKAGFLNVVNGGAWQNIVN